jgi:hypothetical protein
VNVAYLVEPGRYGSRLVVTGPWSEELRNLMVQNGIRELMLNYARGWTDVEARFLSDLQFLIGLVLIHRTLGDDSVVQQLPHLRQLQLSTYCSNPVDFSRLPQLEDCAISWRRGIDKLFESKILQRLYLLDAPEKTLSKFSHMQSLAQLSLSGGLLESTSGIEPVERLQQLGLYHLRRLRSISGVSTLRELRVLEVEKCPGVSAIAEVASLRKLQRLRLDDCGPVDSLKELQDHSHLEEVYFVGSTKIIDGDLSVLFELPSLRTVWFQNRRGYSHSLQDVQSHLRERWRGS